MSEVLHSLRAALLTYPAALSALWAIPDRAAFADKVAEMGRGAGIDMPPADILAALAPRGPATPAMPVQAAGLSPSWLPSWLSITARGARLDWIYAGGEAFTAPFADQDFARLAAHPLNQLLPAISDPGELGRLPGPDRPLDGMIFHIGRCGSTLASRMLAQVPDILVLSEPQAVAAVLSAHTLIRIDPKVQQAWLTGVLGAYRRAAGTRRLVLKLDVDSLFDHARLKAASPRTPSVVLHRDPLEVLVAQTGAGMAGGSEPKPGLPPPEEVARWIAALCVTGAKAVAAGARPVGYRDLVETVLDPARPFLNLEIGEADRARMAAVARLDAKSPGKTFTPDSPARQAAADERLRMLARQVIQPAWEPLAALRRRGKR
ncbi:MAG: aspartyl/asparaginyl beta-hydroxylase [Caulobacter sp.]|nr:aspartyl/asparaginyl beta-hydroxylase [Caulobacter sp.]